MLVLTVFSGGDEDSRAAGPQAAASALASQLSSAAASGAGGSAREPGPLVDATVEPDGLGDDTTLDGLAQDCFDGDMQSCDDLFLQSDHDSAYETYGDTCAGRQPADTGQYCTVTFPDA